MTQGAQPGALYQPRVVGWGRRGEGGSREREHVDTRQKPTQYCKAIILQLKINNFLKMGKVKSCHRQKKSQKKMTRYWC